MNARPYQLDCLAAFESGWQEFPRQLGVLPTGSGKTRIFCWLAENVVKQAGRVLILVDQKELVTQAVEKIKDLGLNCQIERAEHRAERYATIVVATVQTISGRLDRWLKTHFELIICDEADKSLSSEWQKVLAHFNAPKVAGFTATPNRTDKRCLGEYYNRIAYEISLHELIQQGYLSRIVVKQLPIKISLKKVSLTNGDFDKSELDDAITPHLHECAMAIKQHAAYRRTLVFVPLIATSEKFVTVCRSLGINAEHIDGTSEDRTDKLKRFERGDFDVLVNSQLLTRGIDIPPIDCVFPLRPTKSITLYLQEIGRGTRLAEFKENLLILDPFFEADKRLVCRPAHLIAKSQDEAEAITEAAGEAQGALAGGGDALTAVDLLGCATAAQAARERALRRKLEEHQDKQSRLISAEDFAMRANKMDVAEYEPTMKWEGEAVTEKQRKYLDQAGIDIETVHGKGHASQLLSIHFGSQPINMAAPAAVALMCKLRKISASIGISSPEHATQAEAGRFFAELNKRKKKKVVA